MIKHYENEKEAHSEKHEVGEVWFVKKSFNSKFKWYVQFPKSRDAFTTKTEALKWAAVSENIIN